MRDDDYELAVHVHPKRANENAFAYIVRIAELVEGEPKPLKAMPKGMERTVGEEG